MNKAMTAILAALIEGREMSVRGTNMETGERGKRYEIVVGPTGGRHLYYWGHRVAAFYPLIDRIEIDSCGYKTKTTKQVINVALKAFNRKAGSTWNLYANRGQWWLDNGTETCWGGSAVAMDAHEIVVGLVLEGEAL